MNPFAHPSGEFRTWVPRRFAQRPVLIVLLSSLVLGLAAATWRAKGRVADAQARARNEALAVSAALQAQLTQPVLVVEVLEALAKQSGGLIPNFQKVAGDLLGSRPTIASLELLPGGVIREVVPRAGNERAIGFNLLKDPAHRLALNSAMQTRGLTVAGPLRLHGGETGIRVLAPVFQRARDGVPTFWGFVASTMRLSDAFSRAQVIDLVGKGYNYAVLAAAPVTQQSITLAQSGPVRDALEQPIYARNLEMRLALRPRGGWINSTWVLVDVVGLGLLSGVLCLIAHLWFKQRHASVAFSSASRELAQAARDRERTLQELERNSGIAAAAAEANIEKAHARASELQFRLEAGEAATNQTISELRQEIHRLQAALEQGDQTVLKLQGKLEAALRTGKEAAASAQAQLQLEKSAGAELRARLDAAARSLTDLTESNAATLDRLQTENRQLEARRIAAEANILQLTDRLREAEGGLERVRAAASKAAESAVRSKVPDASEMRQQAPVIPEEEPPVPPLVTEPEQCAELDRAETVDPTAPASDQDRLARQEPASAAANVKTRKSQKADGENQMDLFGKHAAADELASAELGAPAARLEADDTAASRAGVLDTSAPKEHKQTSSHAVRPRPLANAADVRKAVHEIIPLLSDQDPGARDCLNANRDVLRSAFTSEAYQQFEELVESGDLTAGLEHLKKMLKRHGL